MVNCRYIFTIVGLVALLAAWAFLNSSAETGTMPSAPEAMPSEAENSVATKDVIDMLGRPVRVPARVDRVVCLGPGCLRLLTYLGASDRVCGVEDTERAMPSKPYILATPRYSTLPSAGPMHGGDPELILATAPGVIFWTYCDAAGADDLQGMTGVPVVAIVYGDIEKRFDLLCKSLDLMGEILDTGDRARLVVDFLGNSIADLKARAAKDPPEERVYAAGVSMRGSHGFSSTESSYGPFVFLGAANVSAGLTAEHPFVDPEQILAWNPDRIFVDAAGLDLVRKDVETGRYSILSAVSTGKVHRVLPYNSYATNFGTVIANSYYIGKIICPVGFHDIDPVVKAGEVYSFLLKADVYPGMVAAFGGFGDLDLTGNKR